jgi:hypothetical protein
VDVEVKVIVPTPRIAAVTDTLNHLFMEVLPAEGENQATPDEIIYLALWMLRCAGRCLQRTVDCETFTTFAHQAYHQAEETDLDTAELALKRYDPDADEPRH